MRLTKSFLKEAKTGIIASSFCILGFRFVVVKRKDLSFVVYYGTINQSNKDIIKSGKKITNLKLVQKLVNCDDEILNFYKI